MLKNRKEREGIIDDDDDDGEIDSETFRTISMANLKREANKS